MAAGFKNFLVNLKYYFLHLFLVFTAQPL